MFFGGGFPSESVRRRQRYAHREEYNHNQNEVNIFMKEYLSIFKHPYTPLLQLFPLIAILVLGLVAQFMVADPAFSLQQSQ